jgi:hypothetical protein
MNFSIDVIINDFLGLHVVHGPFRILIYFLTFNLIERLTHVQQVSTCGLPNCKSKPSLKILLWNSYLIFESGYFSLNIEYVVLPVKSELR